MQNQKIVWQSSSKFILVLYIMHVLVPKYWISTILKYRISVYLRKTSGLKQVFIFVYKR